MSALIYILLKETDESQTTLERWFDKDRAFFFKKWDYTTVHEVRWRVVDWGCGGV